VLVAAALGAAALAFATPASAAAPCWKQILSEWTDTGRVSSDYSPLSCYSEALKHVPEDLAVYTDIEQDIMNARQLAARGVRTLQGRQQTTPNPTTTSPNNGLYNQAIDKLGPTNADSVPLPLLILAGLSLILITAGGAGLVSRRFRARKVPS
jgi:hypothetical protein